ncbi:dTMP kinase [Anderseniella sp. Alg231-50]|uniref:dTMP kinase n=1 Tax=Anderseniella sp. Alg231-50 TaxID=1922226 RepID=UPI000D553700
MKRALFITFEGGEGTGKSTQTALLADRLRESGHQVVETREPGGSPDADAIRQLLVSGETGRWSVTAEILLNYAARESHLHQTIVPALENGAIVICDRFADSTRAYQGYAGDGDHNLIEQLDRKIVGHVQPNLTLVFDLDPGIGLERAGLRGGDDRFERKGLDFHNRLRDGYLAVAGKFSDRCSIIDASGSVDMVAASVWQAVVPHLGDTG